MKDDKIYLDKEGYEQYLLEIEHLKSKLKSNSREKSKSYVDAVGDGWHDNFAFEDAKRQESMIIDQLEKKLNYLNKIVIIEKKTNDDSIDIGDTVKLKIIFSEDDVDVNLYKLTGGNTANIKDDISEISLNSALGKAIYKRKPGEEVTYSVADKTIIVYIMEKALETL